jgi:hypothetical protein
MSEPHERIWAKNGYDSWGQYGHWYADSKGGGVEYVRADRIEELEAENKTLRSIVDHVMADTGDDPEIMAASRAEWAARVLEAEAKLAKAVEALKKIAEPKVGPDFDWAEAEAEKWRAGWYRIYGDIARTTIAELKGEK